MDRNEGRPATGHDRTGTVAGGAAGAQRSRAGILWTALGAFVVLLLVLLIFIIQNSGSVEIKFITVSWHLPLGVALLLSAVVGALLVLLAGTVRIIQLRLAARQRNRAAR